MKKPVPKVRPPCVTIVSTHTVDRVLSGPHPARGQVPGGPALYIAQALERLHLRYELLTGERAIAEVIRSDDGEEYIIPQLAPIPLPEAFAGDAIILSPVMQEIDPNALPPAKGFMVADLQGFVREPNKPQSQVRSKFHLVNLIRRCRIVKGSVEEVALLDGASRRELQKKLLVITRARNGAVLRLEGTEWVVEGRPVETGNTTGAGDTFLAAFVAHLLRGHEPPEAATQAVRFTERFLKERQQAHVENG